MRVATLRGRATLSVDNKLISGPIYLLEGGKSNKGGVWFGVNKGLIVRYRTWNWDDDSKESLEHYSYEQIVYPTDNLNTINKVLKHYDWHTVNKAAIELSTVKQSAARRGGCSGSC